LHHDDMSIIIAIILFCVRREEGGADQRSEDEAGNARVNTFV
jgi:hypothetical protein